MLFQREGVCRLHHPVLDQPFTVLMQAAEYSGHSANAVLPHTRIISMHGVQEHKRMQVFISNVRYDRPILTKIRMYLQILWKLLNISIRDSSVSIVTILRAVRSTDWG
jgi:hypothetical protein